MTLIEVQNKLEQFIETMNAGKMKGKGVLTYRIGKKYFKIVSNGGAWGFVDAETGDLLKPASWAVPAKHSRGNIFDADIVDKVEWTGPRYLR